MRIKVVSDGTGRGTKITNAETGELIEGVIAVKLQCLDPGGVWVARLKFSNIEFEIEAGIE
jgi:hypothetical protein